MFGQTFARRSSLRLQAERLESRYALSASWQNPVDRFDVNNDLTVTPLDALVVINRVAKSGSGAGPVQTPRQSLDPYFDTSGDNLVTPLDALLVINRISRLNREGGVPAAPPRIAGEAFSAPAGFISLPIDQLPGRAADQFVLLSSVLELGDKEFHEFGVYVADDANGTVAGLRPSDEGYASAVFQSANRRVLSSRYDAFRVNNEVALPAGSFVRAYVLQSASTDSRPESHLQVQAVDTFTKQVAWEQQAGAGVFDDALMQLSWTSPIDSDGIPMEVENLLEADGTPDNKSRLTVSFPTPVRLLDATKVVIQGAITLPVSKTIRLPILDVNIDSVDSTKLHIITGQQIPLGALVSFQMGSLGDAGGTVLPAQASLTQVGISTTDFSMTNRAFAPRDINLFTKDAFPEATTAPVPPVTPYSEEQAVGELTALYNRAVAAGKMTTSEISLRLEQYSSAIAKEIIPDAKLRAALFSLAVTSARSAIEAVITSDNQTGRHFAKVSYSSSLTPGTMISGADTSGARLINVSVGYVGEPIELIGAVFAHEVMHQDGTSDKNGQQEEVLATFANALVWAQQIKLNPALALANSLGVRSVNTLALALVNSGNLHYPGVGIVSSPQIRFDTKEIKSRVFFGGNETFISLDNYARTAAAVAGYQDVDTPGNSYLASVVAAITGSAVANVDFSRTTRDLIDTSQTVLSNEDPLQLAKILNLTVPPQESLIAKVNVRNLTESDGTPDNKSEVAVEFDEAIELVDMSKVAIEAQMTQPVMKLINIPVLAVSVDFSNAKRLVIRTGQQVPRGAVIRLLPGAISVAGISIPPTTVLTPEGINTVDFNMTNRAFVPTDINLFIQSAFPKATIAPDSTDIAYTEQIALNQLAENYNQALAEGRMATDEVRSRLEQFSTNIVKAIIPDIKLRTGVFSLAGTTARFAIDSILSEANQSGKRYKKIDYDSTITSGGMVSGSDLDGARIIKVSDSFRGESIEVVGANISHEVIHQDSENGQQEEVIADMIKGFVWGEYIQSTPSLALINSIGARNCNTLVLALLNSGNAEFPSVGVVSSPQVQTGLSNSDSKIFIGGSEHFRSFDNYVRTFGAAQGQQDVDTDGNSYLDNLVHRITGSHTNGVDFSRTTRNLIDANQTVLSNKDALRLAKTLKLTVAD